MSIYTTPIRVDFNTMDNGTINCPARRIPATARSGDTVTLLDADGELTATATIIGFHARGYAELAVDGESFRDDDEVRS